MIFFHLHSHLFDRVLPEIPARFASAYNQREFFSLAGIPRKQLWKLFRSQKHAEFGTADLSGFPQQSGAFRAASGPNQRRRGVEIATSALIKTASQTRAQNNQFKRTRRYFRTCYVTAFMFRFIYLNRVTNELITINVCFYLACHPQHLSSTLIVITKLFKHKTIKLKDFGRWTVIQYKTTSLQLIQLGIIISEWCICQNVRLHLQVHAYLIFFKRQNKGVCNASYPIYLSAHVILTFRALPQSGCLGDCTWLAYPQALLGFTSASKA